jgi:hypothetical protein
MAKEFLPARWKRPDLLCKVLAVYLLTARSVTKSAYGTSLI